MRKHWMLLVVVALVIQSTACTSPASQESIIPKDAEKTEISWQAHTEPVTFTMISQVTEGKSEQLKPPDWGEDAVSRMIMDLTGVKLEIKHQGIMDRPDVPALVNTGEVTDLICVRSSNDAIFLENSELCFSLDELAQEYCPDFWDDIDPLQRLNNQAADGHIYTIRNNYNNDAVYNDNRIPVFPAWMLNINHILLGERELPESIEELDDLLHEEKRLRNVPPLGMLDVTESPLPSWMGLYRDLYWNQDEKMVRTPLRQEGWLDYLVLMNLWYRDGLITMPSDELKEQNPFDWKWMWITENTDRLLAFASPFDCSFEGSYYEGTITADDPWPWTVLTSPLTYENQDQMVATDNQASWDRWSQTDTAYTANTIRQSRGLFITRACQKPDRALYFMQFLMGEEGAKLTHWGIEGTHYDRDTEGLIEYKEPYQNGKGELGDNGIIGYKTIPSDGVQYWDFMGNDKIHGILEGSPIAYITNATAQSMRAQRIEAGQINKTYTKKNRCPALHFATPNSESDWTAYTAAIEAWEKEMQLIVVESQNSEDVAERWQALQGAMANMGLDALEAGMTERFASELKRYHEAGYYVDIQP